MITIDWGVRIIHILKNDLTLIQSSPTEIRELNLNWFRLQLKDLEDSEEGMCFPDTHRHNTEVVLAGLTYARVIEIINGYTITFEDGQYAVNLVGANSNVGDAVNVNQVSIRVSNSAGMTSSPAIEYASFNGGVAIDILSSHTGTIYPVGTPSSPVNNLADALLIAELRGFNILNFLSDFTFDSAAYFENFIVQGQGKEKTTFTFEYGSILAYCALRSAKITGFSFGIIQFYDCYMENYSDSDFVENTGDAIIQNCLIDGNVSFGTGSAGTLKVINCWADDDELYLNYNGAPITLLMRGWTGKVTFMNCTNAVAVISMDVLSGEVIIDSSCTAGLFTIRGIGKVINNSNLVVDTSAMIQMQEIEYASYQDRVTIDVLSSYSGTTYPVGTLQQPVNNLADAILIAENRGFKIINLMSNFTIASGENVDGYKIESSTWLELTIESGASVVDTEFTRLSLYGQMCGSWNILNDCWAYDITNFRGWIRGGSFLYLELSPYLEPDPMTYGSTYFDSIVPMYTNVPSVVVANSNVSISFTNACDIYELRNLTDGSLINMGLAQGKFIIDSSCIGGVITVSGIGKVENNSDIVVNIESLINTENVNTLLDIEQGDWQIINNQMIFKNRDGTELMRFNLLDATGDPTMTSVFKRERV